MTEHTAAADQAGAVGPIPIAAVTSERPDAASYRPGAIL